MLHWEKIVGRGESFWRRYICWMDWESLLSIPLCSTLATVRKPRGTAMGYSELPLLLGAPRSHQPALHGEAAGEGGLPALQHCVLHAGGSQLDWDLLHSHTALQILELPSNDGGFQFDAMDGCKKKIWFGFFFLKKRPKALANLKYYTSCYKKLSLLWVPGNSSIEQNYRRVDNLSKSWSLLSVPWTISVNLSSIFRHGEACLTLSQFSLNGR